jgi:heme A synthase
MYANPVLLSIWAALGACFLALLVYRGQLTRYEDEQLFLNSDSDSTREQEKLKIVSRIQMIGPALQIFAGATVAMTAGVVGMYVWNAWKSIH